MIGFQISSKEIAARAIRPKAIQVAFRAHCAELVSDFDV